MINKITLIVLLTLFLAITGCSDKASTSSSGDTTPPVDTTPPNDITPPTDTTPPIVISTNPTDGVTGVERNTSITATFNEGIDSSTVNNATFTVSGVAGTVTASGTTATFTPSNILSFSTAYTATIAAGVKDITGNAMTSNYIWTFTTERQQESLTWDAPTTYEDGTELTDLAGYNIYYGTSSGNYGTPIEKPLGSEGLSCQDLTDRTECTYTVEGLTPGTYYFAVTSVNTSAVESILSNEAIMTIN